MSSLYQTLYITKNGVGATGLSPSWVSYKNIVSNTNITPQASIDEIGDGLYRVIHSVDLSDRITGLVDAGNTIVQSSERFIPVVANFFDDTTQVEVVVSAALDEPNQSMLLSTYMEQNGQIVLNDLASASIQFYDYSHNLLFTVAGASAMNGVFVLAQSTTSIALVENRPYYALATITLASGDAFSSVVTLITLQ